MQRLVIPALVAIVTVLGSPVARADGPAPSTATATDGDEVHLRSGGLLRGHVTEIVPGDHVTVIVGGETKRLAWAEVDRVVVGSAPAAPEAAPGAGPRVRVHIRSPRNVILYRRPNGTTSWVQACTSPCNAELPLGDSYRVTGVGVPASAPFTLEGTPGSVVEVEVDPASTGGMLGGGFLAATGVTAGFVGFVLAVVGQAAVSDGRPTRASGSNGLDHDDAKSVRNAGLVTMLVGGGMTLAGLLVFANAAKTDVTQTASSADHAFVRTPTWRTASSTESAAPATFPLVLQGTF